MTTLVFTGGHHSSALVVAQLLKSHYHLVWFGHKHSSLKDKAVSGEYTDVTAAGIPFVDLKAGKLYRSFHPLKLWRLVYGFFQAFFELLKLKSTLKGIVSFGGYLAVPTVLAGRLLGIRVITHEQTIVTGWANWLISKLSHQILLTWPQSAVYYPPAKVTLVGLPLRLAILDQINSPSRPHSHKRPVIYVTGGKQGSHTLNQTIFAALPDLVKHYTLIHQTGQSTQFNDHLLAHQSHSPHYTSFTYGSTEATTALSEADLVISRSGAHICYELAVLGKRAVLIPIPWSSHNEQYENAKHLASAGLAILLPQDKLSPQSLSESIGRALSLTPKPLELPLDAAAHMAEIIKSTFT